MPQQADEKIILAVDAPDIDAAQKLLTPLRERLVWAKIGLQLFTAAGPDVVRMAMDLGLKVFLDLKFHDIPNTAARAVASARKLGVSMTTIHLGGGPAMVEASTSEAGNMLILGVTVLTSMDASQLRATGVEKSPSDHVLDLARMGTNAGVGGLVASPQELEALRGACGPSIKIVTPGIRPAGSDAGDQRRTASPAEAIRNGADFLVVGRPITSSPDPLAAFLAIEEEIRMARHRLARPD